MGCQITCDTGTPTARLGSGLGLELVLGLELRRGVQILGGSKY